MGSRVGNAAKCAIALFLVMTANVTYAAGSVSVIFGKKTLDDYDWEPLESQGEIGFGLEVHESQWPMALVVSYLTSDDSASMVDPFSGFTLDLTAETTELNIGARVYLANDRNRWFVEGGLASVSAEMRVSALGVSVSATDSSVGYWFGGGVDVMVSDSLSVGLIGRVSDADVTFDGIKADAGGTHFGVFAAYHY